MAIETSRGLLVAALRETGRPVYAINPMAVARYRERHSVARKKLDHIDALTLANILRTDAHAHRRLPGDSDLARAIAVLARAATDAIWRRTRATQELRALLREYYPGFLDAFGDSVHTNLATLEARAILAVADARAGREADQEPYRCGVAVLRCCGVAVLRCCGVASGGAAAAPRGRRDSNPGRAAPPATAPATLGGAGDEAPGSRPRRDAGRRVRKRAGTQ
ncbi:transposase [Rhodococcus jostii]|uniref:IS110 family transposase n=1 Tax=Rhodococcus jostii TaxID=132919 RepID=UPI00364B5D34